MYRRIDYAGAKYEPDLRKRPANGLYRNYLTRRVLGHLEDARGIGAGWGRLNTQGGTVIRETAHPFDPV